MRSAVAAHVAAVTTDRRLVDTMVLIAHELSSNAVRHGGGTGRLRLWIAGSALHCQVTDPAAGWTSPDRPASPCRRRLCRAGAACGSPGRCRSCGSTRPRPGTKITATRCRASRAQGAQGVADRPVERRVRPDRRLQRRRPAPRPCTATDNAPSTSPPDGPAEVAPTRTPRRAVGDHLDEALVAGTVDEAARRATAAVRSPTCTSRPRVPGLLLGQSRPRRSPGR